MKLAVNPPVPWPNWLKRSSAPGSWPAIMERAVEGKAGRGECGFPAKETPNRPLLPQQRRRVARWGLAMGNLKSDWGLGVLCLLPHPR